MIYCPNLQVFNGCVYLFNPTCKREILSRSFICMPRWEHAEKSIISYCRYDVPQVYYLQTRKIHLADYLKFILNKEKMMNTSITNKNKFRRKYSRSPTKNLLSKNNLTNYIILKVIGSPCIIWKNWVKKNICPIYIKLIIYMATAVFGG